jgi:gluconokinase
MSSYFIGVDVGTTSTKAIVFSVTGTIQGIANQGYPLLVPQPGWAEQDPEVIFATVLQTMRQAIAQSGIDPQAIAAVGFGAAMHTLIVLDANHQRLTNSITWADGRSGAQAARLQRDRSELYHRTGTPIHPMSPLVKLLWLRECKPDTFANAAKFISVKEYIFYQLFEQYVVDYAIASATGLFNLAQLDWDQDALAIAGIRADQLSQLVPTTQILRGMKAHYAAAIGLAADTPIVIGASDGVLANLGVGALAANQIAITIGTSGAVRQVASQPITDVEARTFCYYLAENHWVVGGAGNSGGMVWRWFCDRFGQPEIAQAQTHLPTAYDRLIQLAATVPAGAAGLLFLPFLTGERAPYWNADARGVFFGVAFQHERSHFARAVLEGILFSIYSIAQVLPSFTNTHQTIVLSGGFARSPQWRQMLADVFGQSVDVPAVYEASGFGAAVLAMVAVGALEQLSDVKQLVRIRDRHQPNLQNTERYQALFQIYQQVYRQLIPEFTAIADYQRQQAANPEPMQWET